MACELHLNNAVTKENLIKSLLILKKSNFNIWLTLLKSTLENSQDVFLFQKNKYSNKNLLKFPSNMLLNFIVAPYILSNSSFIELSLSVNKSSNKQILKYTYK